MVKVKLNRPTIERLLARRNWSQNTLARRLGICGGYLSLLMTGARSVSPRVRRQMLRKLPDLTFDDLFVIEVPPAPEKVDETEATLSQRS